MIMRFLPLVCASILTCLLFFSCEGASSSDIEPKPLPDYVCSICGVLCCDNCGTVDCCCGTTCVLTKSYDND